jgi:predicted RNA-binding protein with PUA-like domain
MMKMKLGDLAFFYHSNEERAIVGVVEITGTYRPDPEDPRFGVVEVSCVREVDNKPSLSAIKSMPELQEIGLVKQSRLSVIPLSESEWKIIHRLCFGK